MTTTTRRLLLALALVGLASSQSSLYVHVQMLAKPGYLSFCDVSATVSCTTVYQSRYSTLWGTPVALFGAGYYVVVLLLLAGSAVGAAGLRDHAAGYIFALSTIGLGVSLFLAYTSFFVIKAVCLMCLVTYGAVLGLFLLSGARTSFPMTSLPRRFGQDARALFASPTGLLVVIGFIVAATSALAFVPRHAAAPAVPGQVRAPVSAAERRAEFVKYWESRPRVPVPVPAEGAAVLIVKFSDYQCPGCARSYLDYKPILAKYATRYPGAIRVVTRDFPLERECNVGMTRDLHYAACEAAVAARLARGRGRGEAMEEWLYTNHTTLTPGSVRQAAKDVGGITDFDAQYEPTLNQVKGDIALASILNIRVTPTLFVNGVRMDEVLVAEYFELALQYELEKAGKVPR